MNAQAPPAPTGLRTSASPGCRLACGLLLCLATGVAAHEVPAAPEPAPWGVAVWRLEEGLPQDSVEGLLQTRDGFLWISTQDGLARFDGVRFTVFRAGETPGIAVDACGFLLEDPDGTLWIATDGGGLLRRRGSRFTALRTADGLPGDRVRGLARGADGSLWVATHGGGLGRLVPGVGGADGHWSTLTTRQGLPSDNLQSLLAEPDGTLWIGTYDNGLARLRNGRITRFGEREGLAGRRVHGVLRDRAGRLWVGTSAGLARLDGAGRSERFTAVPQLAGETVWSLLQDRHGTLWIGTSRGLLRWNSGALTAITPADGLADGTVRSLLEDREGNLWAGTFGGLTRLRRDKFALFTARHGLPSENTWAVFEDRDGVVWAATTRGLWRWQNGRAVVFDRRQGLSDEAVRSLAQDRDGTLWVGTLQGGLNRLRDGRFTALTRRAGLPSDSVFTLLPDRQGRLWAGTNQGLALLDRGRITVFDRRHGLPHEQVWSLHLDRAGGLWVGTRGGLVLLRDGAVVPFPGELQLRGARVYSLAAAGRGLWIGTDRGLHLLRGGRLTTFTERGGLFNDTIYQILDDRRGSLWFTCPRGVFRVALADLAAFGAGRRARLTSVAYGPADGLRSPGINGGSWPAGWRGRDGRLWFPTLRGLAVADPARLPFNRLPPPVEVEEMLADGAPIPSAREPRLPAGARTLEIRYTALSLVAPENVRFRYRLVGFDPTWVEAGDRRTAFYTNLGPGRYTFEVVAANNDGVWNRTPARRELRIAPRFYQRFWFPPLAALLLVAAATGAYRLRVRVHRGRNRELWGLVAERTRDLAEATERAEEARRGAEEANRAKSQFLANVSHEIRNPVHGLLHLSDLLLRSPLATEQRERVTMVRTSAETLLSLVNDILDLSKVEAGRLELRPRDFALRAVIADVVHLVATEAADHSVELRLEIDPGLPELAYSDPVRLRQILLNLVGNAVRFSHRGTVTVRAARAHGPDDQPLLRCEVRDTGPGIPPEIQARLFQPYAQPPGGASPALARTGLGLAISKSIVELKGGEIGFHSEPGRGSLFWFRVPLRPPRGTSAVEPAVDGVALDEAARRRARQGKRLLVVDDDPVNRLVARAQLLDLGFAAEAVDSGRAALAALAAGCWDAVLLDCDMPDLDGYDTCRELRRREAADLQSRRLPRLPRLPIIAVTAYAMQGDQEKCLTAGMDDYLTKPYRSDELAALLDRRLGLTAGGAALDARP